MMGNHSYLITMKMLTYAQSKTCSFDKIDPSIISETELAESIKDDEGTWLPTNRKNLFLLEILARTKIK